MTKHWNRIVLASVCAAAIAAFSAGANASMVTNGDFNDFGTAGGGPFETIAAPNSTTIAGWTVSGGSVDWIHGYWPGSSNVLSDYSVDLSGLAQGTIQQVITGLVFNQWYNLTFDVAINFDRPAPQPLQFTLGSATGVVAATSDPRVAWTSHSFIFQWLGGDDTLSFTAAIPANGYCCYGPALDNVELNAVPLPAALPLFAAGLGVMGYIGSRRRRKAALAA